MKIRTLIACSAACLAFAAFAAGARAASGYGCFVVTAPSINIRDGAFSSSAVIATANRGQILVKRHRFCTLRGFWCAVRTKSGAEGWADKAFMERTACPPGVLD